jgi:hypothetical protein
MIKLKNILAENMRRFKTKNLNERGSEDNAFGLWTARKSLRSHPEFQLDLNTVNIGDVLEAYELDKNTPIGRGTVVGVDNAKKRVELSDIEFLDADVADVFRNRGSKKGLNRIYSVASSNSKLQGWKKLD